MGPRGGACMLSKETSPCNLPLTYRSGMAIGTGPVNKTLLYGVQFPTGQLNEETKPWVLFFFFFLNLPDCYLAPLLSLMTSLVRIKEEENWKCHCCGAQLLKWLSACHHCVSASLADQEEITMRCFREIKGKSMLTFLFFFFWLCSKSFVGIKEEEESWYAHLETFLCWKQ